MQGPTGIRAMGLGLVVVLLVFFAVILGINSPLFNSLLYQIPRQYQRLVFIALLICLVIWEFLYPRNPFYRSRQIILVVVAAAAVPLIALQMWRERSRGRTFTEWAQTHGFTLTSESGTDAEETLPDSLRRLPLFRRGWEPETQYLLEQNEGARSLKTLIFEYVTWVATRTPSSWWLYGRSGRRLLRVTVIAFHHDKRRLPAFELHPPTSPNNRWTTIPPRRSSGCPGILSSPSSTRSMPGIRIQFQASSAPLSSTRSCAIAPGLWKDSESGSSPTVISGPRGSGRCARAHSNAASIRTSSPSRSRWLTTSSGC